MIFGVPSDIALAPAEERRVALTPSAASELVEAGHTVLVQQGAGTGAGYDDQSYREAGADIAWQRAEVMARSDVVTTLARLIPADLAVLRPETPVLAFHQLGLAPASLRRQYAEADIVAVGLDRLRQPDGTYPVVAALAELAGALAPQLAARLLESSGPGRAGVLLGRLPGVAPAEVVILGAGTLGVTAAARFLALGCSVHLLDRDLEVLRRAAAALPGAVTTTRSTPDAVARATRFANVLVGAVRIGAEPVPVLVPEALVAKMRPGAVILDFAIAEGGVVATSRPIHTPEDSYAVHGVWHLSMPRCTTLVARTASRVLSAALLPYLQLLGQGVTPKAHRVFAPAIHFGEDQP